MSDHDAPNMVTGVEPRATVTRFGRLTSPVFVGRERELTLLLDAVTSPPALVLVEGEAGVGKTRLVEELLAHPRLARRQRRVGRCFELSEPFLLGPIVEAVRLAEVPPDLTPVVGSLRPLLPELADQLPEAPVPVGDARAERHRVFRALRELLGRGGPCILVVEDLHWGDQATLDFLRFLAPQLPEGLSLVCTYRKEDVPDASPLLGLEAGQPAGMTDVRVVLRPFGSEHVRDLVASILDTHDVSDAFAEYLFERTAGLPFAVEEVLLLLKQREDIVRRHGVWVREELEALGVPAELRDAIIERLGRLSPAGRTIVQAAAILVDPGDERLLAEVAGLEERSAGEALSEALSSALLLETPDRRFGFRHALARQAIEDAVPGPVARRLHLAAARALLSAGTRSYARLARHYRAAGETETWIRYAEAAAQQAVSLNDHATAYRFLAEAVAVEELPPTTRGRLAVELARHAIHHRVYEEAIPILRDLLEVDSMPRGLAGELRFWLGSLLREAGNPAAGVAEAVRALDDLEGAPAARAMAWLALPLSQSAGATIEQRLRWLDDASAIADVSNDRATRIAVAADRAALLLGIGDPGGSRAIEALPQPGSAAKEIEQAVRGYGNFADALLHLGHYERAAELNGQALALARKGAPAYLPRFEMTDLQLDWVAGRWNRLEQKINAYVERVEDWPSLHREAETLLGLVLLARGRSRRALVLLRGPVEEDVGDLRVTTWIAAALARVRLAQGNTGAAVEEARRGLRAIEESDGWVWAADVAPVAAEALLRSGRREEAESLVRRLADGIDRRDAPAAGAALLVCRALWAEAEGDLPRAARLCLEAEHSWLGLPRPYDAIRARAEAGRFLLEGDPPRAFRLLGEALDAFFELGARWDGERVRRTLREHSEEPPHRRGRKGYGSELSPREREIAELVVEGLGNREIALALFLSVKTVEGHVASIRRKLGVTSRADFDSLARL